MESILKLAQEIQSLARPSVSPSSFSLASQSPSLRHNTVIALPDPLPIQPALITAGAHPEISLEMERAYQKRAADLRTHYQSTVTVICSNQAQYPSKYRYTSEQKILSVFTELYLRQLASWREEGVALYLQHASAGSRARTSSCTPKFNHVSRLHCRRSFSPS
jgi:hypothetical protein